jgi:uncharacterized protein (UPF0332 family)
MPRDSRHTALSMVRLEQARDCLTAAESLIGSALYKDAANRAYYCIFHSLRAVLALDEYDSKRHSGIISEFQRRYIKTGVFETHFSKIIESAFMVRGKSDYEDFFVISKADVIIQLENAKAFLFAVEAYINSL